jgi:hypothetical protein
MPGLAGEATAKRRSGGAFGRSSCKQDYDGWLVVP